MGVLYENTEIFSVILYILHRIMNFTKIVLA